jgi:hypothetical protein
VLDDLCELYGGPYPLVFPYSLDYIPNNLVIGVGLVCSEPSSVEPTSWGRVKALFE